MTTLPMHTQHSQNPDCVRDTHTHSCLHTMHYAESRPSKHVHNTCKHQLQCKHLQTWNWTCKWTPTDRHTDTCTIDALHSTLTQSTQHMPNLLANEPCDSLRDTHAIPQMRPNQHDTGHKSTRCQKCNKSEETKQENLRQTFPQRVQKHTH